MNEVVCDDCGRARAEADGEYSPMQAILGQPFGWYSGRDGNICPDCFTKIFERANGVGR